MTLTKGQYSNNTTQSNFFWKIKTDNYTPLVNLDYIAKTFTFLPFIGKGINVTNAFWKNVSFLNSSVTLNLLNIRCELMTTYIHRIKLLNYFDSSYLIKLI